MFDLSKIDYNYGGIDFDSDDIDIEETVDFLKFHNRSNLKRFRRPTEERAAKRNRNQYRPYRVKNQDS